MRHNIEAIYDLEKELKRFKLLRTGGKIVATVTTLLFISLLFVNNRGTVNFVLCYVACFILFDILLALIDLKIRKIARIIDKKFK